MVIYNRCFAFGDHFAALWVTGIYGSVDGQFKGLTVEGLAVGTTGDKPFYLQHALMKTHADNHPPKEYEGDSARKFGYNAAVVEINAYVGEFMKVLEETGLLENTLVFFTSDNGKSMRDKIFVWSQNDFLALRMYEYKAHLKMIETDRTFFNVDMATRSDLDLAPSVFNLYTDPKEQYPVGHRRSTSVASLSVGAKAHGATFKKFPPKEARLSQ